MVLAVYNERDLLWRKVISIKFGEVAGGLNTSDIRGGYGNGLWENIRKDWITFYQNTTFSLGNGRSSAFEMIFSEVRMRYAMLSPLYLTW